MSDIKVMDPGRDKDGQFAPSGAGGAGGARPRAGAPPKREDAPKKDPPGEGSTQADTAEKDSKRRRSADEAEAEAVAEALAESARGLTQGAATAAAPRRFYLPTTVTVMRPVGGVTTFRR